MHYIIVPSADTAYFESNFDLKKISGELNEGSYVKAGGYTFPATVYATTKAGTELFDAEMIVDEVDLPKDLKATLVARPLSEGYTDVSSVTNGECPLADEQYDGLMTELLRNLKCIARYNRRNIELIIERDRLVPPNGTSHTLRVVLGGIPPGYSSSRKIDSLFDVAVCETGYRVGVASPSIDQGYVVKNDQEEPVAQIIDDTIYLLLPMHESCIPYFSSDSSGLFRKALICAWDAYLLQEKEEQSPAQELLTNAAMYSEQVLSITKKRREVMEELDEASLEIAFAQRQLRQALEKKQSLVIIKQGLEQTPDFDPEAAWKVLNDYPLFDRVTIASDGKTHYFTTPIIITDDTGKERFLGRYGFCFNSRSVDIWSLDHPHPSGVPHPHINLHSQICLGNVTESVHQLMATFREAEAVVLVMRLLSEGYEPTLTEHPLEEWPTVQQHEERKKRREQPLSSISHADTDPDTTGGGGWRWLDRVIRRAGACKSGST
jgi:hypothetical protein